MENESENNTPSPAPSDEPKAIGETQQPTGEITAQSENDWAMITHLSGLLCLTSIPAVIGPLVVWLIKKDQMPKVNKAGKDALNFHLTMLLVCLISIPLMFILIGFVTLFLAYLLSIIFSIIGGLAANRGEDFNYPLAIPFIK